MTIKPEKFVIAVKRENRKYSIESKIHIAISLFYAIANHNFLDRNEGHFYAFQTNTYIKKREDIMPQHKSPLKRMKTDKKRAARNNYVRNTIRTLSKKIHSDTTPEEKEKLLSELYSKLDKAAKKGVIHKRTASRRKSRLADYVNKAKVEKTS